MNKSAFCKGIKAVFFCLSLLLAVTVAGGSSIGTAFAESYDAEDVEITRNEVTYTCDFKSDGTATISKIVATDDVTAIDVPSSLDHAGKTYTVTMLKFSSGTKGKNVEQLTLPNTLTKMSGWYFSNFAKVKELSIPGSIKKFELKLQGANGLEKLTFEEGVEEISSNMMIDRCTSLKEIKLPSTLRLISESSTFAGASALKNINLPEGVVFGESTIGMFQDCSSLTNITLPASLTSVPHSTFKGCTSLTSVSAKGDITAIEDSAFKNCTSLPSVSFSGTLTSIGASAFEGCTSLTAAPDLSHVTKMGSSAFGDCENLSGEIDLSSLDTIPDYAFLYVQADVTKLSSSLKSIGNQAFVWGNLKTELPNTLTKIGAYAFYGGTLPETLVIPDSVTSIERGAFGETSGVKEVAIGSGLTSISPELFENSTVTTITVDNSKDDVTGTDNFPSSGVEVTYLRESIEDSVDDTISNDAGAPTLQDAVNAAPDGEKTTITIKKHVKLSAPLSIPAGKKIKLVSDGPYTVLAKTGSTGNLVEVAGGASLEVAGDVTLRGRYNTGSVIDSKGAVVLSRGARIIDGSANTVSSGVVNFAGAHASFTLKGGSIENCRIAESYCATVRATDGAHIELKSGSILSNYIDAASGNNSEFSTPGIALFNGASLKMSGGDISNNSGCRGSAVVVNGAEKGDNERSTFVMTGGTIANNKSNKISSRTPSGAVHVEGNAEFTMTGGTISGNSAAADGKGGGVCVVDPGVQGIGTEMGTAFTLKASSTADGETSTGTICNNSAHAGGGVYSYSNHVALNAGTIKDNTAASMGGGVYSEGNDDYYSTLHIKNVRVVKNTATEQGGGLWFCPSGDSKVYIQDGGLIAQNTADRAGDDIVFTGFENDPSHTLTLASRVPGGGKVLWYRDGGLFNPHGMLAATNPDVPRFAEGSENGKPLTFTDASPNVALKSVMTGEIFQLGESQTTLLITGNKATRGGGIGANGGVVIGRDERIEVSVKKVWADPDTAHPSQVTVKLLNGDTVLDSLVLSDENSWSGLFTDLPKFDVNGSEIAYTVEEDAVDGFRSEVTGSIAEGFTVTNTEASTPTPDVSTPGTPTPNRPGSPQKPSSGDKLAKTGDASAPAIVLAIAAAAVAFGGAFIARRKSSPEER